MGITDKAKQLRDKVAQSGEEYIDKARDKANQATGGRFGDQIDKGADKAKDATRKQPDEQGERIVAARTPVEERLLAIWENVLRRKTIGIHDNFFDLGGHSLLATQVASRILDEFQIRLPLSLIFAHPTIAGLASQIEMLLVGKVKELTEDEVDRLTAK